MKPPAHTLGAAAIILCLACSSCQTTSLDTQAAAGRTILNQYANAVVGVELVATLKVTMANRPSTPREQKIEANGTVISQGGLTVVSLGSIDPRARMESQVALMSAMRGRVEFGDTEFKEVRLRLADGSEVPARVVMKDPDLDLAFVAPEPGAAPGRKWGWVNLAEPADGVILGTYYDVARAPKAQQRTPVVRLVNVGGIIEKPRRFYIASAYSPGCPVFDPKGRVLGICTRHISDGRESGPVILPAADIAESAKQAEAAPNAAPTPASGSQPSPAP